MKSDEGSGRRAHGIYLSRSNATTRLISLVSSRWRISTSNVHVPPAPAQMEGSMRLATEALMWKSEAGERWKKPREDKPSYRDGCVLWMVTQRYGLDWYGIGAHWSGDILIKDCSRLRHYLRSPTLRLNGMRICDS